MQGEISGPPQRVRRIVVGTDLSKHTEAVVASAVAFGRTFDAALDLVHVRDPLVYTLTEGFVSSHEQRIDERIDEGLASLAERVTRAGVPCVTTALDGSPPAEIVRHAQQTGADLIVVGAHGRGGLAHAVTGSVAQRVIHRAQCPVLLIPVEARRS